MANRAVDLSDLRFTYRGTSKPALDGVDLQVDEGEVVVVVGPSGAGKSTICLCCNGLIPHFVKGRLEGEARVFAQTTREARVPDLARLVGLVFQDFEAQLFSTNVELEVAFGMENFAVPREEMQRRVAEALRTVALAGLEHREPATLSGGQKQRLAIATVLALEPRALVMDEPTTDLDPRGKEEVFAVARRLRAQGVTLLIVEHETEEAAAADRVVVFDGGRIAADGPPQEILTRAEWLEARGVQPVGAAQLLNAVGEVPTLVVDEAVECLRRRGYHVPDDAWEALTATDDARAQDYGEPVLEAEELVHRYPGGVLALDGVDLAVRHGEFVAVIGSNGSGKTTLVKHFNGLLSPTDGVVRVSGADTRGQSVKALGRTCGYVFQNPDHQIFAETVADEVAFGPRNHGVGEAEIAVRVEEALAAVGLTGREAEDPFTLTKGERQRVAVASVLATRPRVIVLDEPTTGLDYREQRQMMELVRRLNAGGHTIVCVTHAMWVVAEYAHRTVVMARGRVVADGSTRTVLGREDELRAADLKAPQLVQATSRLGRTLLTVDEVRRSLRAEARP